MWLFLWIVFVLTIIAAFVWSYHVLFEQKRAWAAFAKKYNLDFAKGAFFQPPAAGGLIKGRQVNLYSQRRYTPETGTQTVTSVVEVFLTKSPNIYAVVTSPGFIDFVSAIDLPEPFIVQHPSWPQNFMSRTLVDEPAMQWFLANEDRVNAVAELAKLPFDVGFVANDANSFVVVRTSHPLTDPKRINQIMGKLFAVAEMLEQSEMPVQEQTANPNAPSDKTPSLSEESNP